MPFTNWKAFRSVKCTHIVFKIFIFLPLILDHLRDVIRGQSSVKFFYLLITDSRLLGLVVAKMWLVIFLLKFVNYLHKILFPKISLDFHDQTNQTSQIAGSSDTKWNSSQFLLFDNCNISNRWFEMPDLWSVLGIWTYFYLFLLLGSGSFFNLSHVFCKSLWGDKLCY